MNLGAHTTNQESDYLHLDNIRFYTRQRDYLTALACASQLSKESERNRHREYILETMQGMVESTWGRLITKTDEDITKQLRDKLASGTKKNLECVQEALNAIRNSSNSKLRAAALKKEFAKITGTEEPKNKPKSKKKSKPIRTE